MYEHAARLTGNPAFGLHVGERTSARMYGVVGYVAANSANFGASLEHLLAYQRLWTDAVGLDVLRDRTTFHLRYWQKDDFPPQERRQESEQMLSTLVGFARSALSSDVQPEEVRFEHPAPPACAEHKRIFGCPVIFGAKSTEIIFSAGLLGASIVQADAGLQKLVKEQAETALAQLQRKPFARHIEGLARDSISGPGGTSVEALAAQLGIGPRTLQRRLREHGLTARVVIDEARIKLAKRFLENPRMAVGQIAHRLGYSQPSAFHRAFKRQTGTTPQAFRKSLVAVEEHR